MATWIRRLVRSAQARWPLLVLALGVAGVWLLSRLVQRPVTPEGPPGARHVTTTARGDNPGPTEPKVLWAYKARENYVARAVPGPRALYVPGLGAFNTGVMHALDLDTGAGKRVRWSTGAPFIKRPTVCAPAIAGDLIVFGDGMHQTDDAVLYCLEAETGLPVWQYPVPGRLVHLEGSPVVDRDRVYIGGGNAGVLCVDLKHVTLDGRPLELAAARALTNKRWAELLAQYEAERKKAPDLAVPPSEEALPKPRPQLLWQQGREVWHVDAPVAVAGDRLLVASAYLDDEKIGRRSLLCLKTEDGSVLWETPLKVNPWAGPTIAGDVVLVGCSSIRFDTKKIREAGGEVVAVDLLDGRLRWRKEVPGGVLSAGVARGGLALFTATDGKLRAWDLATGAEKWAYDAGAPFFGGPAAAGGVVYSADLKGALHAVRLSDGRPQWVFDLGDDRATPAPGQVFGSPVVHNGRIYLTTSNLEASLMDQTSVVACVGDRSAAGPEEVVLGFRIDRARRTLTIPCRIAPRKLATLTDVYPIEVIASYEAPRGLKAHETVVTVEARPSDVHRALEGLGLTAGVPARGLEDAAAGPEVRLLLELPGPDGRPRRVPIEKTLVDQTTGRSLPVLTWRFTGSALRSPDPDKPRKVYGADVGGTLITVLPVTDETVFQSHLTMQDGMLLKLETDKSVLPAEGTSAWLIVEAAAGAVEKGVRPPNVKGSDPFFYSVAPPEDRVAGLSPLVTSPVDEPSPDQSGLLPTPVHHPLPPAGGIDQPHVLPSERLGVIRYHPEAGMGTSPAEGFRGAAVPMPLPSLPSPPPAISRAVPSPAANRLAIAPSQNPYDPAPVSVSGDPVLDCDALVRLFCLAATPTPRSQKAPFLPLTIPDPFELDGAVRLAHPPPDDDPPIPAWEK